MKIKTKHFILFVALLITLVSVVSAADIDDTSISSDVTTSTISQDIQQTDTTVITENKNNNEIKNSQQAINKVASEKNSGQTRNTTPTVWNLNNTNFDEYITESGLNTIINDSDILNFTENIYRTSTNYTVDKPININGNGFTLDLNTIYGYNLPSLDPTWIEFNNESSNSNITNLKFHNTQVFTTSASNITFDNINVTVENQGVGMYTGYFALRNGVINVTVKNSYFHGVNNTGCSAIAVTMGENCTIDNNVVIGEGTVGNLIYLNTYNAGPTTNNITQNKGNKITNNNITGPVGASICYGIAVTGPNNLIENNTIYYNGSYGITTNWIGSYENVTDPGDEHNVSYYGNRYINNTIIGTAKFSTGNYSIVENNTFGGTSTIVGHANVTNNIFLAGVTVHNNVKFHSNNATGQTVNIQRANSCFKNNIIGTLYLKGAYTTYDCGNNTLSVYNNKYKSYYVPCNGTCPNCGSSKNNILLKNTIKHVKTDGDSIIGQNYTFKLYGGQYVGAEYNGTLYNNGTLIINITSLNTNFQYDTLKINSQELFTEVKNMVLYIKYSSTMLPKDFGFKLKFDGIDKNNVDLTYIFDNDQYSAKMFDFMLEFKSDFKSTTFENFNLIIRNEINDDEPVYVGIKVNSNVILRNCNIEINLPDSFDEKVIDLSENTLIENCTFTYDVPLIFYFDDSHTDYWEEDGLVFTSTGQGNTTINNNVFIINSFEKSHDFEPVEYAFGIVVSGENFIFTNNEVNIRYVRPILITSSKAIIENNTITSMDTDYTINITGDNNIVRYNTLTAGENEGDSTVIVTGEGNVVEQNPYVEPGPSTVITENTYSEFFDDECLLRPEFNNTDLTVSGNINEKVFIFDGVNATVTNDGTATLTNCQFSVGNDATVVLDGIKINNTDMDAILLESTGNIINNSEIIVTSAYPLHAVEIAEDGNIITNTIITATIASADVAYDKDYVGLPQSSALYISSNNNLLDNVTVSVDGTSVAEGSYYPSIDAIDIQSTGKGVVIENNTITNSKVIATGSNYVYGINVGRAKDTTIENVDIDVDSDYYTNGIQLFDAVDITIDGTIDSTAATQAYGVYATAMAVGTSSGIDLTGLNISVESPDATGVLIEGASDVVIADATYDISGDSATAVNAHVDWMGNIPENITVTGMDINIDTDGDANVLYFGLCDDITITDNNIETTGGSRINFNKTSNAKVTDNYIVIKDIATGYYGNYAVMTNEDDTIVENNEPTTPVVEELQDEINNLTQTVEDQQQTIDDLQQQLEQLQQQLDQLNAPKATQILFDPIEAVYNSPVTITGELTDDKDNLLHNKNIIITFNGKTYTVKTKNGVFEFVTDPIKSMDEQTITAAFEGNEDYNATQATTTFTMNKQNTSISIDEIADVKYQDIVTITGTFKNANGQALTNSNVKVTVNGQTSTVKTDANGVFTLEYKASTMGENTVTVSYAGNAKYNGYETTTTFNTDKKDTILTIDEITDVKYQDTITITGTFKNADGSALRNSNVVLYINGEYHTVRTDNNGVFTYEYKAITMGENNITVTYAGNARYNAAEATTTFTVDKKDTVMTVDTIADVNKGDSVTVTGTFKNADGTAFRNSNVIVYVNGAHHTVKTDNSGNYNYTFTAKLVGDNEIRVVFNGNNKYNACETTTTFTVKE